MSTMTLKPFKLEDIGAFIPNKFSNPDEVFPLLWNGAFECQTMWGDDGLVQAFLCYRNYHGRCWSGFFLISEHFQIGNSTRLRDIIASGMGLRGATRLQTESVSCPELRKWHRFLGFELEGVKVKMMFDRDYDMWAIVREGV